MALDVHTTNSFFVNTLVSQVGSTREGFPQYHTSEHYNNTICDPALANIHKLRQRSFRAIVLRQYDTSRTVTL